MEDRCLDPEVIDGLLAGRLDAAAVERAEEHVDACRDCRVLLSELARQSQVDLASSETLPDSATFETVADPSGPPARGSSRRIRPSHAGQIGRYVVERRLGAGGMGVVLLADDPELKRKVVIKLLRPELVEPGSYDRERLLREAQAMAKVSHPNVVPIYDVGIHEDRVFLAMEYIDGGDLAAWLKPGRPTHEVIAVFVAAGRGLAAAHRAGLVHRDFKPHNVMIGAGGEVKVTDFGLARAELATPEPGRRLDRNRPRITSAGGDLSVSTLLDSPITQSGALVGTPAYMAPEQILGEAVDARTDQFSFCIALYEALYGERPFAGRTTAELFDSTLEGKLPEALRRPGVPARVRHALRRGLSLGPADRFPSMQALLAALAPPARRSDVLVAAIAAVTVVAASAVAVVADDDRGATCDAGTAELARVWNPARRTTIEQAFVAVGTPQARAALAAITREVDRYAASWRAGHRDACEATRVRGVETEAVMARRMNCLRRRRVELDAMLEVMIHPDARLLEEPTAVLGELTSPSACSNVVWLANAAAVQLPDDPAIAKEVLFLELEHAKAHAEAAAQRLPQARERLLTALVRGEKAGYKPLLAELHHELGMVALAAMDYGEAEQQFHTAVEIAEQAGEDHVRALSFIRLVEIAVAAGRHEEAERWARYAESTAQRLGQDRGVLAQLDLRLADIAKARGDFARAEAALQRAIQRLVAEHGPTSREVGAAHRELGMLYHAANDFERAYTEFALTRDIWTAADGGQSIEVAHAIGMMATARRDQHRYAEAIQLGEQELALMRATVGEEHPVTVGALQMHALALHGAGRSDEAIAIMKRCVEVTEREFGADHVLYGSTTGVLAVVYNDTGRYPEAYAIFERSLALFLKQHGGEDHADVVTMLNAMGAVRAKQERYADAIALFRRSLAILGRIQEPTAPLVADTLTRIGNAELGRKRPAEALTVLEAALAKRLAVKAPPSDSGWTKNYLARALWEVGRDRARAKAVAAEAQAELEAAGDTQQLDKLRAWLAKRK